MFSTIRSRLLWLVGLALVPALAILAYDVYLFQQRVFRDIEEDAFRAVSLAGLQLQAHIEETRKRCRLLAEFPEIQAVDGSSSRILADLLREEPLYVNLAIVDIAGRVVSSALPFQGEVRVGERPLFKDAVASGRFVVGAFGHNPITPRPALNMAYPIRDRQGSTRGALWVSLGLEWATDFVAQQRMPEGAVLLVIDSEATVLARSLDPQGWVGKKADFSDLYRRIRRQPTSGMATGRGVDGVDRLYAFAPVQVGGRDAQAFVTIGIPTAAAAAIARQALLRNLFILLVGAIACIGIAWIVAERFFLRETRALLRTARRLEAGDLAARTGLGAGTGELREVAHALDTGVVALEKVNVELVEARHAAESANRAKSAFLAVMSHEIRTPMNAILNMTGLALETELTPRQQQYLSVAHGSARNLLGIINDILDFSKIEAEKLELEQSPFSLRSVLDDVTETFRAKVVEKHVELVTHVPPGVPDRVVGDALRVRQVLTNLVGNAFKFTERGEIVVKVARAARAEPGQAVPDGTVRLAITVRDTGVGIPAEHQERLFAAFSQADSSTSRKYGGTGLGLAISRRLARMMGGDLTFESEAGRGTEFTFTATLGIDRAGPEPPTAEVPAEVRERPVLVVEDNDTSRELLEVFLAGWSIPAVAVASAEEGLALIEQRNLDGAPGAFGLVVLDWMLPGMSGLDMAARLRAREETRALPIVLISAYAGKEEEARAAELGVNVFLPKPVTASSFLDAVVEAEGFRVHSARRRLDVPLENRFGGVRALLAEDNEANQMVATELLSRLGIELDIAATGREAVEMARANTGRYVGILMDMQMPEMDGLEATRVLRADPAFRQIPIIAMTANAMKADLDACLAAGMNDHITKPIERGSLVATLDRWFPKPAPVPLPGVSSGRVVAPPPPASAGPAAGPDAVAGSGRQTSGPEPVLDGINVEGALARLGLGFDSLKKMLVRFAEGQGRTVDDLRAAVSAGDAAASARHAHALAGAAGNLGADSLREAAKALETAAREGRDAWAGLFGAVEERAAIVFRSIGALRGEQASQAAPPPAVPLDPARLRGALERLQSALDAGDPAATEQALAGLGDGIPEALTGEVGRVRALAEGYAFEEAGAIVTRLLNTN